MLVEVVEVAVAPSVSSVDSAVAFVASSAIVIVVPAAASVAPALSWLRIDWCFVASELTCSWHSAAWPSAASHSAEVASAKPAGAAPAVADFASLAGCKG